MSKWTREPGRFVRDLNGETWNQAGLSGGGFVVVSVDTGLAIMGIADADADKRGHVLLTATAALTPEQARSLAMVLNDAADAAEDESAEGAAP